MKFKDLFIVPIIGLGFFDEQINTDGSSWYIRTIIILCFKLQFYNRTK